MDQTLLWIQQHLAWLIAAVGLMVTVIFSTIAYRRASKAFSYFVVINTKLIQKKSGAEGKIEIFYEDQLVEDLRLIKIEMRNSGGKEIEAKDFFQNVEVQFAEGSNILEAAVESVSPEGINPEFTAEGSVFQLKPLLLNAGDRMMFRILVNSPKSADFDIAGRISGVKNITEYDNEPFMTNKDMFSVWSGLIITGIAYLETVIRKNAGGTPLIMFYFIGYLVAVFSGRLKVIYRAIKG